MKDTIYGRWEEDGGRRGGKQDKEVFRIRGLTCSQSVQT